MKNKLYYRTSLALMMALPMQAQRLERVCGGCRATHPGMQDKQHHPNLYSSDKFYKNAWIEWHSDRNVRHECTDSSYSQLASYPSML